MAIPILASQAYLYFYRDQCISGPIPHTTAFIAQASSQFTSLQRPFCKYNKVIIKVNDKLDKIIHDFIHDKLELFQSVD